MARTRTPTIAFISFFVLMLFASRVSPALSDEIDTRIDRLLAQSSLTKQLEMLGPALLSTIPWDAFPDQKTRNQAETAARQTVEKDRLLILVRQTVRADYREAYVETLLQFYDSKLGRKVGRLIGNSLDQDTLRSIWEGRTIVTSMNNARRGLIEHLVGLEITGDINSQLSRAVVRGLVNGFLDHTLEGGDLIDSLGPKLEAAEKEIVAGDRRTNEIALAAFAHTLQSLNDAELKALIAFQESEPAAWFRKVVQDGLETAVFSTSKTIGEMLARAGPTATTKRGPRKGPAAKTDPGGKDLVIGVPKAR